MMAGNCVDGALRLGFVALLSLGATLAQAQFKCVDAQGSVSFQQLPCAQGHKETSLGRQNEPVPQPQSTATRPSQPPAATRATQDAAPSGASSVSPADVQGDWCITEVEILGAVKVPVQLKPDGQYVWGERNQSVSGRWKLVEGQLAVSSMGMYEILGRPGREMKLSQHGAVTKFTRGRCV